MTVPPYCGVPADVGVVIGFDVVDVGMEVDVDVGDVVVVLVVVVGVEVDDVVLVVQDAKTSDATMRQVSSIQIIPLFI